MRMRFRRFQEGGPMPAGPAASGAPMGPEQGGGEDPVMMLAQMAQQALEGQDCEAAMQVCDGLLQLLQGGQSGPEGGPEGGAPAPEGAPAEEPVYRAGGKLVRRINR